MTDPDVSLVEEAVSSDYTDQAADISGPSDLKKKRGEEGLVCACY